MATRARAGHLCGVTGLRRVFTWLIVVLLVVMLVSTLVLEDAS
jgi:hypothetical protein